MEIFTASSQQELPKNKPVTFKMTTSNDSKQDPNAHCLCFLKDS